MKNFISILHLYIVIPFLFTIEWKFLFLLHCSVFNLQNGLLSINKQNVTCTNYLGINVSHIDSVFVI